MGKDFQRAILWVLLFTSCFLLWDNYQVYKGEKSFFPGAEVAQKEDQVHSDASIPPAAAPSVKDVADVVPVEQPRDPVVVTTDCMKVTFDLEGAAIVGSEMTEIPKQADWTEVGLAGLILGREPSQNLGNVHLMEMSKERLYVAQSGLVGGNYPNHRDVFKLVSNQLDMGSSDKLDVIFEAQKGDLAVRKVFEFTKGHYAVNVRTEVKNNGTVAVTPSLYYQITRDSGKPVGESSMYQTFTGPALYSDENKFEKISFDDIVDHSASFEKDTDNGWIAMVQHHFVSAWVPTQGVERENYVRELGKNLFSIGSLVKLPSIAPGQTVVENAVLYSGPQDQKRLEQIAPGLELVVDYGWLTFLAKPIYWLLSVLHDMVGNWGWAIVLLTCIVKLILYPISAAGYRSMARMKEITPRMKQLQDRYKDDKQRLNQAMMELYRSEKINPVGGCLPLLLQIPVFLALYWVLMGSVELRGAPWILWVHDLAMPDPWFILPLLMAVTMFLQILLNPKPTDPVQARMMYIMPVVFSVMFFIFASGLVLYWLTNNILSIIQQWWINKTIAAERAARLRG